MRTMVYVLLLAMAVPAALGGTITNGNASLNLIDTLFSSNLGNGTLLTDTGASDQLYQYCWYYRTPNNNQNRYFGYYDTPTTSYVGNTLTATWTNAGPGSSGVERFNANMVLKLYDGALANQVQVTCDMTITNPNAGTVTYQFFNITDLDLNSTATNDIVQITNTNAVRGTYTESGSANYAETLGIGAAMYQAGSASTIRGYFNGGALNLNNSVGPYTGDGAIAHQWTVTLAPGQSTTLRSGFSINAAAIPEPASLAMFALLALLRRR
jgi:hypothetical protein